MAYGKFNKTVGYGYNSYTYTETATGQTNTVHIFKTNPATMRIAGAVSSSRTDLANLNPPAAVCSPSKVLAKINGNYLDTTTGGKPFYGMFYAGGQLSYDGLVGISPTHQEFSNSMYNGNYHRVSPSLGMSADCKTATIRWPNYYGGTNILTPQQMTAQFPIIVAGQHCLVHHGVSVFESTPCYSWEGLTIADWGNLYNHDNHHNEGLGGGNSKIRRARTFFGHGTDGACYLVCVVGDHDDSSSGTAGMTLKSGAHLMCDLGCDYAINMDGGSPTQMRVSGEIKYSRMGDGSYHVGSAICAYSTT